jgi:nucleotide-binding universal stress UspA family protein
MKILAAVDGSAATKRMVAYLSAHDEWLGTHHRYSFVTVVPAVPPRAAAVLEKSVLEGYYNEQAEAVFKPLRKFVAQRGIDAEFVAQVGPAAEKICKLADSSKGGRYDLVLMGSRGHGRLMNLVLGSVATQVLAGCDVPVLLVR